MNGRRWVKLVGFELAVVALLVAGIVALIRGASGPDGDHAMAATPTLDLADVPTDIAANYRYTADHLDEFAQIPCYCGCDHSLGHRNLADCYVNPNGGWDPHASGCAVCGAETVAAREQLLAGASITEVRASIVNQYGPPPDLFASGAQS